jgi:hypothetical protein
MRSPGATTPAHHHEPDQEPRRSPAADQVRRQVVGAEHAVLGRDLVESSGAGAVHGRIAASSVWEVLNAAGVDPAPE